MERNDVSFSIPTWRKEQIKSINFAEEEALYMTSPYNLNDFKNQHLSIEFIFSMTQQKSQLRSYSAKRQLNGKVKREVAIFTMLLYQIIINDNHNATSTKLLNIDKLPIQKNGELLGIFKQKILQLNLCKFKDIPKQFQPYYRNEIIKKIIFQYIGKCAYNISLIQLLLVSNDLLRFSVELCVKTVLYEGTLLSKFTDSPPFDDQIMMLVQYFSHLLVIPKQIPKNQGIKFDKLFHYEKNQLKSLHFLLKSLGDKIYLYRKQVKNLQPDNLYPNTSSKQIQQIRPNSLKNIKLAKGKPKKQKTPPKKQVSNSEDKSGFFWCCSFLRKR